MQITEAKYLGSFPSVKACPELQAPEYAFVGRSNVGKSSLINMLCHKKDLARVSNQPGKTQTINLYEIDGAWILADLPGYGYAKVSRTLREGWSGMIRDYLLHRKNLMCVFVLLDARLPLQEIDQAFLASLGQNGIPLALVYTKMDKVAPSMRARHLKRIESALMEEWAELPMRFVTSAQTREGRELVLEYIAKLNSDVSTG